MKQPHPQTDPFGLAGKTCVVTGAASGIGRGIALALAAEGAAVAVLDRNAEGAAETAALIEAAGHKALAVTCDIAKPDSVIAAATTVAQWLGPVWGLVNSAGVLQSGGLTDLALEDWNHLFAINLTGYLLCSQVFGRQMLAAGGGSVVHVSSIGATHVTTGLGAYSVTKAGVIAMSNLFAAEWGSQGVRSNVILPGLIQTPLAAAAYDSPEKIAIRASAVPLRRVGQPDDLAQVALFLVSPRSAYVTGAEIAVDGGLPHNFMSLIPRFS